MKNYWRILRNHGHPVRFVAARLLMATGLSRHFTIRQRGYRLRFHDANLSSQLWIDPCCRDEPLAFFRDYLEPGDHVVDVGANVGDTVLAASVQVGSAGRVVGIEAHPRTFGFLRDNVKLNGAANVELIHGAAGDARGTVAFSDDRRDDMNRVGGGELEVTVERLDTLVQGERDVALLKIDVEGYEKPVLEGAPRILSLTRCVHFEVSSVHFSRFGYTTRDVLELLAKAGFRLYRMAGASRLEAIALGYDTEHFENLLALRDEADFARRTGWTVAA